MSQPGEPHLAERDFQRLRDLIYTLCGIHLVPAKQTMVELRLRKRLQTLGLSSYGEYCDYVLGAAGEAEVPAMIDLITTNKTDFYREPAHFDFLTREALPSLQTGMARPLRVWSAGCSSGEEPYSLAMVLAEYAARTEGYRFSILATDISRRVLEKARLAIYNSAAVEPVPPEIRRKYLLRSRDRSKSLARVAPEIRALVQFRRLNLMDSDFGLKEPLDIIFCRNVVIYFDKQTQEGLVRRFVRHLRPHGYLFMGHSETLHGFDVPLLQVSPTVYRKAA